MGFKTFDAAHLAFAERGGANVLLTTDDRFENRAKRLSDKVKVTVENPTIWYSNWMKS